MRLPNITRTLEKLAWAQRIIVVDSGSTDGTLEILARYPRVALFTRTFDNFADQCNFGLAQVQTEWALSLDADYELSDRLVRELVELGRGGGGNRLSRVVRLSHPWPAAPRNVVSAARRTLSCQDRALCQ